MYDFGVVPTDSQPLAQTVATHDGEGGDDVRTGEGGAPPQRTGKTGHVEREVAPLPSRVRDREGIWGVPSSASERMMSITTR